MEESTLILLLTLGVVAATTVIYKFLLSGPKKSSRVVGTPQPLEKAFSLKSKRVKSKSQLRFACVRNVISDKELTDLAPNLFATHQEQQLPEYSRYSHIHRQCLFLFGRHALSERTTL